MNPRCVHVLENSVIPAPNRPDSPNRHSLVVFLVHGYHNSPQDAHESYESLYRYLEAAGIEAWRMETIWEVYWPGYWQRDTIMTLGLTGPHTHPQDKSLASALSYSFKVRKAPKIGELLADYVSRLRGPGDTPSQFIFIAHSLGCRVVMEVLRKFAGERYVNTSRFPGIALMAAAVPTYMLEYSNRLWWAAYVPQKKILLYSGADWVLSILFPPGQALAGEGLCRAVGGAGEPASHWNARIQTGLGHSGYWKTRTSTEHLLPLFGKAIPSTLEDYTLPVWLSQEPRAIAENSPSFGVDRL